MQKVKREVYELTEEEFKAINDFIRAWGRESMESCKERAVHERLYELWRLADGVVDPYGTAK